MLRRADVQINRKKRYRALQGERIARDLNQITEMRGLPDMVFGDNGTELTSNAIFKWQQDRQAEGHDIAPGEPMQNGFIESFNGRLRMNV